ncbi:hypothetical protein V5799_005532 [Amblyomma americanum]|uniref:Uncharacterized protein n=1 Tax=Amblyomma americanum TaxID=6943 RepID=A0AAQ4DYZ7_AMBAM
MSVVDKAIQGKQLGAVSSQTAGCRNKSCRRQLCPRCKAGTEHEGCGNSLIKSPNQSLTVIFCAPSPITWAHSRTAAAWKT